MIILTRLLTCVCVYIYIYILKFHFLYVQYYFCTQLLKKIKPKNLIKFSYNKVVLPSTIQIPLFFYLFIFLSFDLLSTTLCLQPSRVFFFFEKTSVSGLIYSNVTLWNIFQSNFLKWFKVVSFIIGNQALILSSIKITSTNMH